MQVLPTLRLLVLCVAILPGAAGALLLRRGRVAAATADIQRLQPSFVTPGDDWLRDASGEFTFLTLKMPSDMDVRECKVLSNGNQLLVVVTEDPADEPVSDALRKYKLVMEALKRECDHDEGLLHSKLQQWFSTEEDAEVREYVGSALESLTDIRGIKHDASVRTISVPLGLPAAAGAALTQLVGNGHDEARADRAAAGIVKESFAFDMPVPVPVERVFVLKTSASQLLVVMPHVDSVVKSKGISLGAQPFARAPVFEKDGHLLAGPQRDFTQISRGLDLQAAVSVHGLVPLDQ